jgi:hypothetical protein
VLGEPFFGGFDGTHLFFADRFVVNGSVGETAGHGIADRLKEMNDGGELLHRQHVEQRVGLLAFLCDVGFHRAPSSYFSPRRRCL